MYIKTEGNIKTIAPMRYITDDGMIINDFPKYLKKMEQLELIDKMFGFEYVFEDELVKKPDSERIEKLEKENFDLIINTFNLDFRVFDIECLIDSSTPIQATMNLRSIKIIERGDYMAQYTMAKKIILAGPEYYDRADMEYKLGRYADKGVITQTQYNELIALMDADEFVNNK